MLVLAVATVVPRALTDRRGALDGSRPAGRVVARIALADRKYQEGADLVVGQGAVWVEGSTGSGSSGSTPTATRSSACAG
jgi:hypothetical protein